MFQINSQRTEQEKTQKAVVPQALQNLASRMKRRVVEPVAGGLVEEVFPITAEILQAEKDYENEILKDLSVGYKVDDKGIYIGAWLPVDREGQSLGKIFHVFAAPEDLDPPNAYGINCRTYEDAAKEVGKRRNWHGHDGIYLKNDTELYKALDDESAIGNWFIPTLEILCGRDVDKNNLRFDHLFGWKFKVDFSGTFVTVDNAFSPKKPDCYWSCTEFGADPKHTLAVRFSDGEIQYDIKDTHRFSCRPIRVELAL